MKRIKDLSIKQKLIFISMLTSTTTLVIMGFALLIWENLMLKSESIQYLTTLSNVLGNNSTAALAFDDRQAALEILKTIKADSDVGAACIYDRSRNLFSSYYQDNKLSAICADYPIFKRYRFTDNGLAVFLPIYLDQDKIGAIQLISVLRKHRQLIKTNALTIIIVTSLTGFLALILASRLQVMVSSPILNLANIAQHISQTKDYSVRATKQSQDEIAILIDSFNQMLDQIQSQNSALQNQTTILTSILENIGDAVIVCDQKGNFTLWNPAAYQIIPFGPKTVPPDQWATAYGLYLPDMKTLYPSRETPLAAALRGKITNQADVYMKNETVPQGVWLSITAAPVKDHAGNVFGAVAAVRDVTERRNVENSLRESRQSLMDAVKTREEFLSIAAHELRTPLTPLKLQIETLRDIFINKKYIEYPQARLERLLQASNLQVDRLTSLVSNLLDVTKISSGRLSLKLEQVNLSDTIEEVIDRYRTELEKAKCIVHLKRTPQVIGQFDKIRIEQVITNLLSNAMKYGAGKPIYIILQKDNHTAILSVRDEGIGIAPADLKRIFGRFERAVSIHHFGGLGLGLYITKQIIEAHRGKIRVSSTLGEGSTFTIELPLTS